MMLLGSEKFEERNVTTIEINLRGKKIDTDVKA